MQTKIVLKNRKIEDPGAKANSGRSSARRPRSYPPGFLTVGQAARVLGVSPSTLRVWENVGLLTPVRSNGQFRLYTPEMLSFLKRIKYLRDVKQIGVAGIKQMLNSPEPAKGAQPEPGKPSLVTGPSKSLIRGAEQKGAELEIPVENLGKRLRAMRKRTGIGIAEAATRVGISAGFLSAIELSRANPSIATLQRLAATYGTTVLEFFNLPHRANRLVRPQDHRILETGDSVTMEMLAFGTRMLQCMMFHVPPNSGSDGAYSHYGEEFIYMLQGTIEFWLDEMDCHILHAGDSFWFDSTMGHRWFNASDQTAVLLWINTPITF